ncbi:N-formylglutamate deformylase [Salinicola corii]|uniref:N-formylglutamate deformylase n=1 Tax=Salinicola corii TaxID=2606937 RepID=A0A640WDW4_9GAMM|nr:N-formylglutamate deformylase [Salinicola corii]KAA0018164.1 N-formylglutamate deformylase [Salinicola corii]
MTQSYRLVRGDTPLLISMPHAGVRLAPGMEGNLEARARSLLDTDWHIPRLYDFVETLGCSRLQAEYSRYVIDLNRPADDTPLYAGATTGLFPETDFDGQPLYQGQGEPSPEARAWALEHVWRPYHQALRAELERLRQRFGYVVLFDAHSIRSRVPRLFEGQLPDINLGTFDGASCDPTLAEQLQTICKGQNDYTWVINGRFKGGYITRCYGNPADYVHAVQLELSQATYMDEPESDQAYDAASLFPYRAARAGCVKPVLERLLLALTQWRPPQC